MTPAGPCLPAPSLSAYIVTPWRLPTPFKLNRHPHHGRSFGHAQSGIRDLGTVRGLAGLAVDPAPPSPTAAHFDPPGPPDLTRL